MITLLGEEQGRFCDGISRRNFLRIGALSMGGLALPDILRAQAQAGSSSHKAIIMIFLPGGPPHQDMYDIKTEAPSEIRGEFKPIRTNVPGIHICELLPRMAGMMDKLAMIRSIVSSAGSHNSFQCMTGREHRNQPPGGWPSLGAVLSRLQGPIDPALPPFVGLAPKMGHKAWSDPGKPGFLGPAHAPFQPNGDEKARPHPQRNLPGPSAGSQGPTEQLRPFPPRDGRQRVDGGARRLYRAGLWCADLQQAGRGSGPGTRRSHAPGSSLWPRHTAESIRRRSETAGSVSAGSTTGRSRGALRDPGLQPLGLAQQQL